MDLETPFDVILVGLGPVGGTAANLAGTLGLRCLAIDASPAVHPLPRAIHLDAEIMRIFQLAGLADRVLPLVRAATGSVHLGMDAEPIREFRVPKTRGPLGWARHYMFFQPEIDALLRTAAAERVDVRLGWTCVGVTQDEDGVTAVLRSEGGTERRVTGRYLLACDGASSHVRQQLGIDLFDYGFEEPWIIVDTIVPTEDLGPDHMVMYCRPERPGTYVPGPRRHRRWEFMLLADDEPEELQTPSSIRGLIAPITPWLDVDRTEVVRSAVYRFHGLVARRWSEGRIFLAGDAVHQTPPFYGQGMCHGIRDVHNLLWKLALTARGVAGPGLLRTYQAEREPHVRTIIDAAIENGRYICMLDPAQAAARDAEYRERMRTGGDVGSFGGVIPPLVAGLLDDPGTMPVGMPLPQPPLGERMLDDVLGTGFALVAADRIDRAVLPSWFAEDLAGRVVDGVEPLRPWLSGFGCEVALVRPDRYVFGVAAAADAGKLVERLASRLKPARRGPAWRSGTPRPQRARRHTRRSA